MFGPSGSGKTTLLDCIAGLSTPDEGEIAVLGNTVYSTHPRRSVPPEKRRIGYVVQDSALFPHMNVSENISYGYKLTPESLRKTARDDLVELFQLSRLLDRSVVTLSGGERQRVALARALATSPSYLLLDEPLVSVDAALRGVVLGYLRLIWRKLRTPMIYVSHSISDVVALAEDVLVLLDGRPVAQGRPSQVLVHPAIGSLADYAALENLLDGTVLSQGRGGDLAVLEVGNARLVAPDVAAHEGEAVVVSVRASDIMLALEAPSRISAQNIIRGTVEEVHDVGVRVLVYVDVGARMVAEITPTAIRDLEIHPGQEVYLIIKSTSIAVLDTTPKAAG